MPVLIAKYDSNFATIGLFRFGKSTGVAIKDLFPTEDECRAELDAEKLWWPDLDESLEKIKVYENQKVLAKSAKDVEIETAMKNMPKWIAQYKGVPLKPVPTKMKTPSIRIKTIEHKKKQSDSYIVEELTPEVIFFSVCIFSMELFYVNFNIE